MKHVFSARELLILFLLLVLILGIAYRTFFYAPLQAELAAISAQSGALDTQLIQAAEKVAELEAMEAELDALFAEALREPPAIAPFDNRTAVLQQLNTTLMQSEEYSLQFSDPSISPEGTVRRNVTLHLSCSGFATAKAILRDLTNSPWRCLITNLSITGNGNLLDGPVQINATVTFLESTLLTP